MLVALIIFVSAMVQGVMGFGMALIAMPLLVTLLGIQVAVPSFALIGTVTTLFNVVRLRRDVTLQDVGRLALPAMIGIPLGVWLLGRVDPIVVTRLLGSGLILYAAYELLGRPVPPLHHRLWAYVVGFTSGVLTGAYNTGGPPVILYASARKWPADRFKGNLQTYFFMIGVFVCLSHAVSGHITPAVWRNLLVALPALILGQVIGVRICGYFSPALFRRLVLILLMVLGIQLLL